MMKININFHSRVLLGFIAVLLLALGSTWIAIYFAAKGPGELRQERGLPSVGEAGTSRASVPMAAVQRYLVVSGGIVTIFGLGASLISARLLLRPVRALAQATRRINVTAEPDSPAGVVDDLTHVASALHGLTRNAHYDSLTGLPNRTLFNVLLDEGLDRARRSKNSLALAFIDLDGFKKINDTLGHEMGDLVLRKTAQRMSRHIKPPSSVSRLGGDEFVLILHDAGQSQALMAVERLMSSVSTPIRSPAGPIAVGMSTGIAIYPHAAVSRDALLSLADAAMYRSKSRKCGPVVAKLGDVAPQPPASRSLVDLNSDAFGETWKGAWTPPTATGVFRKRSLQSDSSSAVAQGAPIPRNETERLTALRRLEILDNPYSASFDRITQLAAKSLDVPIALISLIDERRQWFLSRVGVDVAETTRDVAVCAHVIFARQSLVVPDATMDARFSDNPMVVGEPHVRAYAGEPLFSQAGFALGTLCAVDLRPRQFSADELKTLKDLAAIVEDIIQARESRIMNGRRTTKVASS